MRPRPILLVLALFAAGGLVWGLTTFLSPGAPDLGDDPGRAAAPTRPADPEPSYPEPPPYVPAEEGQVSGQVVSEDGDPVAGARVAFYLTPDGATRSVSYSGGSVRIRGSMSIDRIVVPHPIGDATTDSDGRFTFSTPEAGPYFVTASADGFAMAKEEGVERGRTGLLLRLGAAGRVTGRVVDDSGAPVVAAVVEAPGVEDALTDATGGFRLRGVRVGEDVKILATAMGYEGATAAVAVSAGAETTIAEPLVLRPTPGITGRVFGADGEPLPGAMLMPGGSINFFEFSGGGAVTDRGGRYHMEVERAGEYEFRVTHAEHLAGETESVHHESGRRTIVPDLRLRAGASIVGRIVNEDGRPIAGATPSAELEGRRPDLMGMVLSSFGEATTPTSDARGMYRLAGLEAGTYSLHVEADGHLPAVRKGIVLAGEETAEVDVVLLRGAEIAGVVLDSAGQPVADMFVSVAVPPEDGMGRATDFFGDSDRIVETTTDGAGKFRLRGIGTKPGLVQVVGEGFANATLEDVAPGTTDLVIQLARTGSISGRVVDDATGEPVAGADVTLHGEEEYDFHMAQADEDGEFRIDNVVPGTWTLSAESAVHAPSSRVPVEVVEGVETGDVELRLAKGESLNGVVVAALDGRPVAGATVNADGPVGRLAITDERGRFDLTGLLPGSYTLTADSVGHAPTRQEGVVVPSASEVSLVLSAGGRIRGVVRDAAGQPQSGKMVVLGDFGGDFGEDQAMTGEDGEFVFAGVAPGERTILIVDIGGGGGFNMQSKRVTVVEGEEVWVEFGGVEEEGKARLTGRLLARGEPVAGQMVMLLPIASDAGGILAGMKMSTTDETGRFDIPDLKPGRYAVLSGAMGMDMGSAALLTISEAGDVQQDIVLPSGRFAGQVVRADTGKPVEGARIMLANGEALRRPVRNLGEMFSLFGGQGSTDGEGTFALDNATPGRGVAIVTAPDLAVAVVRDVVVSEEASSPVTVRMERGSELAVRVSGPGGTPLAGAQVSLFTADGTWIPLNDELALKTGGDGVARTRLVPGTWRVQVQASGLAPVSREVRVGGDSEIEVSLTAGGTVRVVATAGGAPVAGADVRVIGADGREVWRTVTEDAMMTGSAPTVTGEDGVITLANLPAGSVTIRATAPDGRSGETTIRVMDGGRTDAALDLR